MLSAVDMARRPLVVLADVEQVELGAPLAELVNLHGSILLRMEDDVKNDEARQRLERLRDEFVTSVEEIRARLALPLRESGEVAVADQHPADVASETAERELDVSREAMFAARLKQIDDALDRVDRGSYGRCTLCDTVIPDERLEVMPDTPFCVADAEREQSRAQ